MTGRQGPESHPPLQLMYMPGKYNMFGALLQYQMVDETGELPGESESEMHGKGIAAPCVNKEAFFVCVELKKCSSLTGLAKLQQFFFSSSQEHFVHAGG